MKKSQKIELQQHLIMANIEALKAIVEIALAGSQKDTLLAIAETGAQVSGIAAAIEKGDYDNAVAAFGADHLGREEEACGTCEERTPPAGISKERIQEMMEEVGGMIDELTRK